MKTSFIKVNRKYQLTISDMSHEQCQEYIDLVEDENYHKNEKSRNKRYYNQMAKRNMEFQKQCGEKLNKEKLYNNNFWDNFRYIGSDHKFDYYLSGRTPMTLYRSGGEFSDPLFLDIDYTKNLGSARDINFVAIETALKLLTIK